jgi:biotin carboxylase
MKKRIIILGAGVMQMPAIKIAKELGFLTIVLDGNPDAAARDLCDRFEHIDLKDKEAILALAEKLKAEDAGLAGIMTAGTDFSTSVAFVAERLGLPGIPYGVALDASDKGRMRKRFAAAGVPSPAFVVWAADDDAPKLPFSFPVVVKPVDNMGGRGCRRVNNDDELRAALPDALRFSRSARVIIEEYMDGPEFSVDAIVCDGEITICGLADRHIFYPPYFIEMGHTMPTECPPARQKALLDTFVAGIRALGINNGAAKGDIKLTSGGPMIGEIAARLSGGYMSGWTYPYASGAEPTAGAILVAAGERPQRLLASKNWTSAERAFISIPGIVASIHDIARAEQQTWIKNVFLTAREGGEVSFPENNVGKCGNVISAAPTRKEAVEAAENAVRSILIRLRPHEKVTDTFLAAPLMAPDNNTSGSEGSLHSEDKAGSARGAKSGSEGRLQSEGKAESARGAAAQFPPSAFQVPASVLAALDSLHDEWEKFADGRGNFSADALLRLAIRPFPALQTTGLRDYAGRTVDESLDAVRALTGLPLPLQADGDARNAVTLGQSFWGALIRGGYQGAVYMIDCLS